MKNDCPGSARSFAQQVQYATDNGLAIAYGNDWNTGVSQLGPRFGAGACWAASEEIAPEYRTRRPVGPQGEPPAAARRFEEIAGRNYWYDGMAHIGMLPELTTDLVDELRTPGAERLAQGAEAFLKMWERAFGAPVAEAGGGGTTREKLRKGEVCGTVGELGVGHRCLSGDCKVSGLELRCR